MIPYNPNDNPEMIMNDLRQMFVSEAAADEKRVKVKTPEDVLCALPKRIYKARQEEFLVVTLDGANKAIRTRSVSKGTANAAPVHAREVFRSAILDSASALVIVHNHPSGALEPSQDDTRLTARLLKAADIIGIPILDHVIVSKCGYYSYAANGKLDSLKGEV